MNRIHQSRFHAGSRSDKREAMRVAWIVYGSIDQATGGYVYDRNVIDGLRAAGDDVEIVSIAPSRMAIAGGLRLAMRIARAEVVVGDELCFRELGPAFLALRGSPAPVLLVHHLPSWEQARGWRRHAPSV